jgi:nucleoside-diphosphate-sugar epimerase
MAKILVTGVNGFIGSHIADRLLRKGHEVHGLVRKTSNLDFINGMKVHLHYGDITVPESLKEPVKGMDVVIHNAGLASDWGPLKLFLKINFEGTQNIVNAAHQSGVQRIVYMSSTAIHGFGSKEKMNENSPVSTSVFPYSKSKWLAENWLMDFSAKKGIEAVAIRPGNVFGPRDHTFIEKYLDIIVKGKAGYVSSGKSKTCPTYVENLAQAVDLACFQPRTAGEAFIITDGIDTTWRAFTEMLAHAAGAPKPKFSIPFSAGYSIAFLMEMIYKAVRSRNAPLLTRYRMCNGGLDYYFSIMKSEKLLGYKPEVKLEEAVKRTVDWYRNKHR